MSDEPMDKLKIVTRCAEVLAGFAKEADSAVSTIVGRDTKDVPVYAVVVVHGKTRTKKLLAAVKRID